MPGEIRNLEFLRGLTSNENPGYGQKLYEALSDVQQNQNTIAQQVNGSVAGNPKPPAAINSLNVTAQDGIFDAKITDNSDTSRGVNYFIEHSPTPNFSAPHLIHLGTSRNWRGALGNQTLHFRAYSSFPTSGASSHVYHGSAAAPTPVTGGGVSGPPMQSSSGGGTAATNGTQGGHGFGPVPFRSTTGKPPVR